MKENNKQSYHTPDCEVVMLSLQRVIAASPDVTTTIASPYDSTPDEVLW
jgi:hypothetical protein